MGYFSATCALSGLAIPGGTPIRVLLLNMSPYGDGWSLRTPPIRAVYNDYGGIEHIDPQDADICDLWRQGLDVDLIEVGTGDNTCHDAPARKGMSFDALCEALGEGRVHVRQDTKHFWHPPSDWKLPRPERPWLPTMARIEEILGTDADTYHIDEPVGNVVRLRSKRYETRRADAISVCQRLQDLGFATVVTAPSRSSFEPQALVFCREPTTLEEENCRAYCGPVWQPEEERHLPVTWAFVRSDVWDAFLCEKRSWGWDYPKDFQGMVEQVCDAWENLRAYGEAKHFTDLTLLGHEIAEHIPGMIGVREHMAMLKFSGIEEERKAHVLDAIAELLHVSAFLNDARTGWAPGIRGSQEPAWPAHLRFLRVVSRAAEAAWRER